MSDTSTSDTPSRILPFRRAYNFRDLGGYDGADGKTVAWRKLFRSGQLAKLSAMDRALFSELDIHTLIDFRADDERKKEPDRLPSDGKTQIMELPMLDIGNSILIREINERIRGNRFDDFDVDSLMETTSRQFVNDFGDEFRRFVHAILGAEGKPVLWHCSGGKDRTGFASAVILRLLGVELSTVTSDYLLSNRYAYDGWKSILMLRIFRGRLAADAIKQLFLVRENWLLSSHDAITTTYGSFDTYRREALALSDGDVETLRTDYLD
jgi:protein-tyrosine phosphatase